MFGMGLGTVSKYLVLLGCVFVAFSQRRVLIGGNWKCNGKVDQVSSLIAMLNNAGSVPSNTEVVIASPSIHLASLKANLRKDIAISSEVKHLCPFSVYLFASCVGCWSKPRIRCLHW